MGIGVYSEDLGNRYSWNRDYLINITVAEMWAIRKALKFVREEVNHEYNGKKYAILADPKSALARLHREVCWKKKGPITLNIKNSATMQGRGIKHYFYLDT